MNEEQILIQKCKEGNQSAQTKLYNNYKPMLVGYLVKNYRRFSPEENEEIINNTFVTVFSTIKVYEERCSFLSWLILHIKRDAYTHIRLTTKHTYKGQLVNNTELIYKIDISDDLKLEENNALNNLFCANITEKLNLLLKEQDLTIISLRNEGYSRKEVAKLIGYKREASVTNLLVEIRKKVKKHKNFILT